MTAEILSEQYPQCKIRCVDTPVSYTHLSLMRATQNRGEDGRTDGKFGLSDAGAMEIMKLFFTPDEELYDKPITDYFSDEVLNSNFWLYWRTMFAFENWHSALEMKLYLRRFIHHIGGLPDFKADVYKRQL